MTTPQDETPRPEDGGREVPPHGSEFPASGPPEESATGPSSNPGREDDIAADASTSHAITEGEAGEPAPTGDDDLPEWEPLTPELVEDEAIRGDFMLRWAVILLAFLLGCTHILATRALVHIKTGQYLMSHGWLPPETDVFSSTASDRPWINLSWLFDLLLGIVYSVSGGAIGVSVLAGLLAAVAFYIIGRTSRLDVSTWWGSICAALALLVCYPQFTAQPELVTLLGAAVLLWLLNQFQESEQSRALWLAVPLIAVWSNLDPRMFLGLGLLVLYAAGDSLGTFLGFASPLDGRRRKQLWLIVAACFGAALLNPFGWHSLAAPYTLYASEYPAFRLHAGVSPGPIELQNFSMVDPVYWETVDKTTIAGLLMATATVVTFFLNRRRLDLGQVLMFLGAAVAAVAVSHELALAAIVGCVLATVNAQAWYQESFRQTYSVETSELLFSRGGRAVTVLAFFGLAYLAVSGRLMGPEAARPGFGFDPRLQGDIDGYRAQLEDSFDRRPFNFLLSQGDILIWVDRKPFIDSRVALYDGEGDDNLLDLHNRTRYSLRRKRSTGATPSFDASDWTGDSSIWKAAFDRFEVTHVVPRMSRSWGNRPDYVTYFDLLVAGDDWALTSMGAVTAVFYRRDLDDPELRRYIAEHQVDFVDAAFQSEDGAIEIRPDWARPPSVYDQYLTLPVPYMPNAIQEASHYYRTFTGTKLPPGFGAALAYLTIRKANEGLAIDPGNADGYRYLGGTYAYLNDLEAQVAAAGNAPYTSKLRYFQAVSAFSQALVIEPDDAETRRQLLQLYLTTNKTDLALRELEIYDRLTADQIDLTGAELAARQGLTQLKEDLSQRVRDFDEIVDKALQNETDRLAIAQQAYQQGYVLKALEVLNDGVYLAQNPSAQRLHAYLLMEAGRPEEADTALARFQAPDALAVPVEWRTLSAFARLANGDYTQALQFWSEEIEIRQRYRMNGLMETLPLVQPPPAVIGQPHITWPIQQTAAVQDLLYRLPGELSTLEWNVALCELEVGRTKRAAAAFRRILDADPETALRPLIQFYLYQITNELIDGEPPSNRIPVTPDMFAPEEPQAEGPAATAVETKPAESKTAESKPAESKGSAQSQPPAVKKAPADPFARWEKAIAAFEEQDRKALPPKNGIVFVGSSSIRLWKLDESFPDLDVINRGFGGSQLADAVHFAERIVLKHEPRLVVLYAGDNDITAGKTPEQVFADFQEFVATVHAKLPETRIVYIPIKPSLKRWSLFDKMQRANDLIAEFCRQDERLASADIVTPMLGDDGKPRPELFAEDGLHLSAKGYELWTSVVTPHVK